MKESTPDARGLVLSNITRFHGTLFRVICLVFGKILIMSNRTSLKQQVLYYLRWYCTPCTTVFLVICAKPFAKPPKLRFNHQCNDVSIYVTSTCLRRAMSRCYKLLVRSPEANSLHCIIEHEYMARGSLHFLRIQLQQNMTGFVFQLGLHH